MGNIKDTIFQYSTGTGTNLDPERKFCQITSVEDPVGSKTSRLDPPILIFDIRIRSRQK